MAKEEQKKIACPQCTTSYLVSFSILGKTVACKKCGHSFTAVTSEASSSSVLGQLGVKYKLITPEQLSAALSIQSTLAASGKAIPLEDILLKKNIITPQQLQLLKLTMEFWEACQRARDFGAFAIKKGMVSQANVAKALQKQAALFKETKTIRYIRDIMVEDGVLTVEQRDALIQELLSSPGQSSKIANDNQSHADKKAGDNSEIEQKEEGPSPVVSIDEMEQHFEVTVSEDRMTAFMMYKKKADVLTPENIRALLEAQNITFGIIDDAAINAYLTADPRPKEPFKIAIGAPPRIGSEGKIKYYFSTNQKIGSVGAQGNIDFKEKGEVPFVHKGDLLAEKIAPSEGKPGTNVHGEPVPPENPLDVKLRFGTGTELSEDKQKIYAKTDGQPKLSFGGRIAVISDLKIEGDVDLKTGHIDFEGNVMVSGTIQNGFRVKCASLSAKEILAADIITTGNITTTGGIIGATIDAQGDVTAKYIQRSTITAFGDVIVEKEITDATIKASGTCRVSRGKILVTALSAKQGIESTDIGTDVSAPCRLTVGVDEHAEGEVSNLETKLVALTEKRDTLQQSANALDQQQQGIHKKIADIAQIQDRSLVAQRELQKKLATLSASEDSEAKADLEVKIKSLGEKATAADHALGELFDKQDQLVLDAETIQAKIGDLEEEIEELAHEKTAILEWANSQKAVPVVKVTGAIFQGTMIRTPHEKSVMKQTYRHTAIREVKSSAPNAPDSWEIKIQPL